MKLKSITASLIVSAFLLSGCSSSVITQDSKGNDVVASLKKKNITADDIYDDIYNSSSGKTTLFQAALNKLIDEKFPINDDMETDADTIVKQIRAYYKNSYGDDYKSTLKSALEQSGYENMTSYRQAMIEQIQYATFLLDYVDNNFDDVFEDYYQYATPREASIIKIDVADTAAITAEEQATIDEVTNLLATSKSFGEIAEDYSTDTSTNSNKGSLGIVDSASDLSSTYGEDIQTQLLALGEGEVSGAITGTSGVYFVKCDSIDKEKIKEELKDTDIDSPLIAYDNYMQYLAFQKYDFKYSDDDLKATLEQVIADALAERTSSREGGTE